MKYSWIAAFLILSSIKLSAQDLHFTQFYASPLTLNPALTGAFDGKYRVSSIYRDQWRGSATSPYQTMSAAMDFRFEIGKNKSQDVVAVGLMVANDRAKIFDSNSSQIMVSGAFIKSLSSENNQFLTAGIQGGLGQRGVVYENFNLPDEWDGKGYNLGSQDLLPANTAAYADLNAGINYTYSPKRQMVYFIGAAIHHITSPNVSYYETDKGRSNLYRKYSAQASAQFPINPNLMITPRILWALQGQHMQINAGTNFRVKVSDYNATALHVGAWVRPTKNVDKALAITDAVLMFGIELNNFLLGMSYDLNLKSIPQYNRAQGAFEISLGYLGNFDNETILCPKF